MCSHPRGVFWCDRKFSSHTLNVPHRCADNFTRGRAGVARFGSMADDDEFVSSFVQADDNALMARINEREAACTPLLRCAAAGCIATRKCPQEALLMQLP